MIISKVETAAGPQIVAQILIVTNRGFGGYLAVAEVEQENGLEVRAELKTPFLAIQKVVAILADCMSSDVLD